MVRVVGLWLMLQLDGEFLRWKDLDWNRYQTGSDDCLVLSPFVWLRVATVHSIRCFHFKVPAEVSEDTTLFL